MFNNVYKDKKVLVTGVTGFKGSWLAVWLKKLGADVYGLANEVPTNPSLFECLDLRNKISYFENDIRDFQAFSAVVEKVKPDFLFHLAAQPIVSRSYNNPLETFSTNIMGTANVLESLRLYNKPCKAIIITSDKCYENLEWMWGYRENDRLFGRDPYSASKSGAEVVFNSYLHSYFLKDSSPVKAVSTRAGNVIGGGDWALDRIVPDCMRAWSQGREVEIRSPNTTRPWQHVLEPLSGYLRCGEVLASNKVHGESFNFGPTADQDFKVIELLEELSASWGGRGLEGKCIINKSSSFHEAGLLKLNCDKALRLLDWKPVLDFTLTSKLTADWYYKFYNSKQFDVYVFTNSQLDFYTTKAIESKASWTKP